MFQLLNQQISSSIHSQHSSVRTNPASSKQNPPSMNNTIAEAITIHTVFKTISSTEITPSRLINH